ncbi:odontogenesis associated phosphoprotein isoform X2 [Equus caballus]|uniref:odontogenesis associated phosphoprotein isoform X2 n=1 Tax=Equus caballus TaxID=9796 RepID=UPI0038B370AB
MAHRFCVSFWLLVCWLVVTVAEGRCICGVSPLLEHRPRVFLISAFATAPDTVTCTLLKRLDLQHRIERGLPHSTASLETLASLLTQYSSGQNLTLHPLPYTFHEHLPLTVSLC